MWRNAWHAHEKGEVLIIFVRRGHRHAVFGDHLIVEESCRIESESVFLVGVNEWLRPSSSQGKAARPREPIYEYRNRLFATSQDGFVESSSIQLGPVHITKFSLKFPFIYSVKEKQSGARVCWTYRLLRRK